MSLNRLSQFRGQVQSSICISLNQRTDVFDQQHQVHGINRCGFEIEVKIEAASVFVDGMDEQGADADGVGGLGRSHQGIKQQSSPKTLSLLSAIYCKPAKESKANRMIGETFGHSRRGIVATDAAGSQRMITGDDIIPTMRDIDLGGVSLLVLPREPLQPFVQGVRTAIKRRKVVNLCQRFNDELGLGKNHSAAFGYGRLGEKPLEPGFGMKQRRTVKSIGERFPLLRRECEGCLIGDNLLGASAGAFKDKVGDIDAAHLGSGTDEGLLRGARAKIDPAAAGLTGGSHMEYF
jgi:hypothetical protein